MRVLVTGKDGQVGRSLMKIVNNDAPDYEFIFVGRNELNFNHNENFINYFNDNLFDIIVNCAAYTHVDRAEEEIDNANQINHFAVSKLAKIAKKQNAFLIHISTDYVFDGKNENPYKENDTANPLNIYGRSKLAGEKAIMEIMPKNSIIIRTSWVYSEYGKNFVKTMLKLAKVKSNLTVVNDQIGSPTYAYDLAKLILKLLENIKSEPQDTQIYHFSNLGNISWFDFAKEIIKLAKLDCTIKSSKTKIFPNTADRPLNTTMDKRKIVKKFNINLVPWKISLGKHLNLN